jgi:c-di-GMP-binding flagellar brake protein YcgR
VAHQVFKVGKELACYFLYQNEIYFFTSKTSFTDTTIIFSIPPVLYKIQRRDNFRALVPKSIKQHLEIVGIKQLKVTLVNLSLGGCKVIVSYPEALSIDQLKEGFQIKLLMSFISFENHVFHCKVKFLKDNSLEKLVTVGLEFEKLKADEIKELQANIFKIDRLNRQSNMD